MELRAIGDAILRLRPTTLSSSLLPGVFRHSQHHTLLEPLTLHPRQISWSAPSMRRTFMTSHSHSQQNSDAATPRSLTPDSPSPKSYEDGDLDLDKLLDFAPNRTPASPSQRTSRLSSPNAQQSRRGNSASDLLENFRSYTGRGSSSRSKVPVERMQSPTSLSGSPSTNLFSEPPKPPPPPRLRLGPSTGRSVIIDTGRGVDLARGFKSLNVNCFLNNVKGDSISQRFHERPGLKRKKLKSRRWRRRFRDGFRAVVSKVEDMRRRGW